MVEVEGDGKGEVVAGMVGQGGWGGERGRAEKGSEGGGRRRECLSNVKVDQFMKRSNANMFIFLSNILSFAPVGGAATRASGRSLAFWPFRRVGQLWATVRARAVGRTGGDERAERDARLARQ